MNTNIFLETVLQLCSYIGMLTTTLSRRISMLLANGAPKTHMDEIHQSQLIGEITGQQYPNNIKGVKLSNTTNIKSP